MPKTDGILNSVSLDDKRAIRFALHGYFRAPMRITRTPRAEGSTRPNEGNYNIRTPYLIDDDYFRSGFAYTPVNESDWAEIYLSVGNDKVTATMTSWAKTCASSSRRTSSRSGSSTASVLTSRTSLPTRASRCSTAGVSWARTLELGGYIFDSTSKHKKPLKELTDSSLTVTGVDLRADTHVAGRFYGATSYIKADQSTYQAPALELRHSFGGRQITENYLGTQSSENGTGSMWNVGFQYDLSLADTVKGWTGAGSPLPWNGDVTASLFGVYSFVQSKQQQPGSDPEPRRPRALQVGRRLRVPRHRMDGRLAPLRPLDTDDSANSFRILSPRLSFFTSFITREMIYV